MTKIEIKSEKQDNGIWGCPLNCYAIDSIIITDNRKLLIFSAVLNAFDEKYNINFFIKLSTQNGFMIYVSGAGRLRGGRSHFSIKYDNYEVIDDILYQFDNQKERLEFLRKNKLIKLENARI